MKRNIQIIPAVDLLEGKCVRLKRGVRKTAKIFSHHPEEMAERWQNLDASILHVVNLDGAFGDAQKNVEVIRQILQTIDIPVELGGGIRSFEDAQKWLELGVERVIFGTAAIDNPELIAMTMNGYGADRVIIGVDARHNRVTVKGWVEETKRDVVELVNEMKKLGARRIIYTDVDRDGESQGPNIDGITNLARNVDVAIIASGGFSQMSHFRRLAEIASPRIEGAIVGTALYENKLNLSDLINEFQNL